MKINSILKLGSLAIVSLGLVSTVALTTTSCGGGDDGPVRTIELVSETPDTWIFHATTTDEIANLQSLEANDKSTTTVKDSKTWAIFNNEAEGAKIKVSGYIDDGDNSVDYVVTFYEADPEVGKYKLKGYYIYDDGSTLGKLHAIIVNLTIVPANEI